MSGLPTERRLTTPEAEIASMRSRIQALEDRASRMAWYGAPHGGSYPPHSVVRDGPWTMVSLRSTDDPPAPAPIGDPQYVYQGTSPAASTTAKTITYGHEYTFGKAGYVTGYRVFLNADQRYNIYGQSAGGEYSAIATIDATTTGWLELALDPIIAPIGSTFRLLAAISEPATTPTTWQGVWDYLTPTNAGTPASGQVQQSSKALEALRIHKTDEDGGDRAAELLALDPGDHIEALGRTWTIQTVTDSGTYVTVGVLPATQATNTTGALFTFDTTAATPIDTMHDPAWWTNNPPAEGSVVGLFTSTGGLDDVVPDGDAYGLDIQVQDAYVSPDWGVVAFTGDSGSGASGSGAYLPLTGGKLTGHLELEDYGVLPNITTIPDAAAPATDWPLGISVALFGTAAVGYPTTYGTLLSVIQGTAHGRFFQIATGRDNSVWIRTSSGSGSDWSPFVEFVTA